MQHNSPLGDPLPWFSRGKQHKIISQRIITLDQEATVLVKLEISPQLVLQLLNILK